MRFRRARARLALAAGPPRRIGLGALLSAGLAAGLAACTTGSVGAVRSVSSSTSAVPGPTVTDGRGYTRHADLAYAEPVGQAHLLDLYVPSGVEGPFPVVLFQAGSAFASDRTKSSATDLSGGTSAAALATMWAPHGYAVVGLNVRSSSQATFPAQVHDVNAAIRWLRAHADEYGLDPDRFATMGTSSGGWGAVMAAVTTGQDYFEGDLGNPEQSSAVQAVVDLFGPTDFLAMDEHRLPGGQQHDPASSPESRLMGFAIQTRPAQTRRADPGQYVTDTAPPVWIAHGTADPLVPAHQSQLLLQAYAQAGAQARLTLVHDVGHTDAYLAGADPHPTVTVLTSSADGNGEGTAPTYATILAWLDEQLRG